jgi:molybdopterin-guanine dinucleotide biosynthesis protein A
VTAEGLLVGIFVGGKGTRMGGVAKGLLKAPGSAHTLIERLLRELRAALPQANVVLVGARDEYAVLGLPSVADAEGEPGPLGGLLGLLARAEEIGCGQALALACDLPFIGRELLARIARECPLAGAVVAGQGGVRNPLVARYAVAEAALAAQAARGAGKRSLQAVLDQLGDGVSLLQLSSDEEASLNDWDTPADARQTSRS